MLQQQSVEQSVKLLKQFLLKEYVIAKDSHTEYEIFFGIKSQPALFELEAAFSHLVGFIANNNLTEHLTSARSHLQRIAIDLKEHVLESHYKCVRISMDPYFKTPILCKLLLVPPVRITGENWAELRNALDLIKKARDLKGDQNTFETCYETFDKAHKIVKALDRITPPSPFYSHLFTLIAGVGGVILGTILTLLLTKK